MTPIYLACYWQWWSAAELLIQAGTQVNMMVADTYSALYFAAKYENCDTVDLLVDADPSLGLEPEGSCRLESSQGQGECCSTVSLKSDGVREASFLTFTTHPQFTRDGELNGSPFYKNGDFYTYT